MITDNTRRSHLDLIERSLSPVFLPTVGSQVTPGSSQEGHIVIGILCCLSPASSNQREELTIDYKGIHVEKVKIK